MLTKEMEERINTLKAEWKDEGDGYYSMNAYSVPNPFTQQFKLAYVAIPENHPLVNKGYHEIEADVEVNGGLTFAEGNVFGWDYGHAYNDTDIDGDIRRALDYFKSKAK